MTCQCPPIKKGIATPVIKDFTHLTAVCRLISSTSKKSYGLEMPYGLGMGGLAIHSMSPPVILKAWTENFLKKMSPQGETQEMPPKRKTQAWSFLSLKLFYPFFVDKHLKKALVDDRIPFHTGDEGEKDTFLRTVMIWQPIVSFRAQAAFLMEYQSAAERLADYIMAVCGLCSIPIYTMYCGFHGTAVVEEGIPSLYRAVKWMRERISQLSRQDTILQNPSLTPTSLVASDAVFPPSMAALLIRLLDWKTNEISALSKCIPQPNERKLLSPHPSYSLEKGDGPDANEIFWAVPDVVKACQEAGDLVGEAGFDLWITAANNRYGGRHPPHSTHSNGKCVDFDWSFEKGKSNTKVPNLLPGKMLKVPVADITSSNSKKRAKAMSLLRKVENEDYAFSHFCDSGKCACFVKRRYIKDNPEVQMGVAKLATWVVLQSLPIARFGRWLYFDTINMEQAFEHFISGLNLTGKQFERFLITEEGTVSVLDGEHWDHLHAEYIGGKALLSPELRTRLQELAILRDEDPNFWEVMFADSGIQYVDKYLEPLRKRWEVRKNAGTPSLLPVWVPELYFKWSSFDGWT